MDIKIVSHAVCSVCGSEVTELWADAEADICTACPAQAVEVGQVWNMLAAYRFDKGCYMFAVITKVYHNAKGEQFADACVFEQDAGKMTPTTYKISMDGLHTYFMLLTTELYTFAQHALAWNAKQGNELAPRGTPEFSTLYERWVNYAFADFPEPKE